jgi:nucleotide-binding universal stress UspA family protein
MYKKLMKMKTKIATILLPTDFSPKSNNALKLAAKMAQRHGAKLIITHVVHTYFLVDHGGKQVIGSETVQNSIDCAKDKLEALKQSLENDYNLNVEIIISTQNLTDSLNEICVSENVDLVIVGTSGRQNMKEFILGSNSYNILQYSCCSVLLVPENFTNTDFKKILFPVRVQNGLAQKAALSVLLAEKNKGGINLLGVGDPDRMVSVRTAYLEMKKNLLENEVEYTSEFKLSHDNAELICEAADNDQCDVILLTDQDENSWKTFMADNFFKKMINNTNIPLFIVKSKLKKVEDESEQTGGFDLTLPIPG